MMRYMRKPSDHFKGIRYYQKSRRMVIYLQPKIIYLTLNSKQPFKEKFNLSIILEIVKTLMSYMHPREAKNIPSKKLTKRLHSLSFIASLFYIKV